MTNKLFYGDNLDVLREHMHEALPSKATTGNVIG